MPRNLCWTWAQRAAGALTLLALTLPAARGQNATTQPAGAEPVPTYYAVGYAHLDTQWRWLYPEVIQEMIPKTMRENLALMEKFPDYVFNFSGANRYRMMQEYWPADFAKVQAAVKAGQWFPCGSSMEESDVNVPAAESLIRQVLYGNHWFRKHLGQTSAEYMLPDCFGFPASLPSILSHCGVKGFSTQKLTWGSAVGIPFPLGIWDGLNGDSVIAAIDAGPYGSKVTEDLSKSEQWIKFTADYGKKYGAPYAYRYYGGPGDEGGSPPESSVQWLETSIKGAGPLQVKIAKADQLFLDLTPAQIARLPHYQGDLLLTEHSAGSITSQAYMKRWNRKNELLADAAERASILAAALGGPAYPQQRLNDAWTLVMGAQFHDILPGTSLPKAYEYSWNDELLAQNQFADVLEHATGSVAATLDTQVKGVALVVYNPLSIERQDVVEARVTFPTKAPAGVQVLGPDGQAVPAQVLESEGPTAHILFLAKLPAVGYAVYDVQPATQPAAADAALNVSETSLENGRYRVTLDANGDVASIKDLKAQRELLAAPLRLAFQFENPGAWPAWNMDWADQKAPPRGYVSGPAKVRVLERGPVRVAVEVTRDSEDSHFVQVIRLAAGEAGARVEFADTIDWQSKECALKATFPLTVASPKATYNWEVGTIERGNNDPKKYEVPSHQWFDLTDAKGDYGVTVLTDCKYGSDKPSDDTLRLTLIYTPGARGGYPEQAMQDWGRHEIKYGLAGHTGDWRQGRTDWQALQLNQPPIAFQTAAHAGPMGKTATLLKVGSPSVRVLAVKKAEDSDETIVRVVELDGKAQSGVRIELCQPLTAAREVNGSEQEVGPAQLDKGALVTDLKPYALRTFAVKYAAAGKTQAPQSAPVVLPYDRCVTSTDGQKVEKGKVGFDDEGHALAAEMLPEEIAYRGVTFKLGSRENGKANAATAQGQTLDLPAGNFNRVYVLAAAAGEAAKVAFQVDGQAVERTIQPWGGYIGQWDNRVWKGRKRDDVDEGPWNLIGLKPAWRRDDPVAWFCSHHHTPDGKNDAYAYSYLYAYAIDLPAQAKKLTLPKDANVRILAVTVANDAAVTTKAAQPLIDELRREVDGRPRIAPSAGTFNDVTTVSLQRAFFGRDDAIRYTLDGSEPTEQSPTYKGPFTVQQETTVKARGWDGGKPGPVAEAHLAVNDTTPPTLRGALGIALSADIALTFSEPLEKASAEQARNYKVDKGTVKTARLSEDGKVVTVTLAEKPAADAKLSVTVSGVRDRAPKANVLASATKEASFPDPIVKIDAATLDGKAGKEQKFDDKALVAAEAAWTINVWMKIDKQLDDYTIIAGFGSAADRAGAQRYITKFPHGLHFWGSNVDIPGETTLEVGKWEMLTATYDGETVTLYVNGQPRVAKPAKLTPAAGVAKLGPKPPWGHGHMFAGQLARFTLWSQALPQESVGTLYRQGHGQKD